MSSADDLCNQFGPRSGLTACQARSGSKLIHSLTILLKEFFVKVNFLKNQQTTKNQSKYPSMQRVKHLRHLPNATCKSSAGKSLETYIMWALTRQNLSSGFLKKGDSNQSPQLQRLARKLTSATIATTFSLLI